MLLFLELYREIHDTMDLSLAVVSCVLSKNFDNFTLEGEILHIVFCIMAYIRVVV